MDDNDILPFLHLIEALKKTPRTGWINEGVENPESIADHMYRMAVITMLCKDDTLDKSRMLKIAIVHDMAEAIVGDITPLDKMPKEEKQRRELEAMEHICNDLLPVSYRFASEEIMTLFLEYEHKSSPEARYVKDVDKYELVLQTCEYERAHKVPSPGRLDEFVKCANAVEHPQVKRWCDDALHARAQWWAEQGQNGVATNAVSTEIPATLEESTQ